MRKTIFTAAIAAVATIALLIPAGAATAGGVEKEKHGQCTPKGRWELSLDKEAGRIEVDFEVTGDEIMVTVPKNRNLVQSGWYMLFVTDDAGTPSEARWVKVP